MGITLRVFDIATALSQILGYVGVAALILMDAVDVAVRGGRRWLWHFILLVCSNQQA